MLRGIYPARATAPFAKTVSANPLHPTSMATSVRVRDGVAFGAGLYEARVVIPEWENIPPRAWPNTGLMFWVYVTTVPLTVLTIANLIAAWLTQGPMRFWYLAGDVMLNPLDCLEGCPAALGQSRHTQ